jgi:AbrB family looped-hinge helix DNA binding protein
MVGIGGKMAEAILDSKGRIMLPKTMREELGLEAGRKVGLSLERDRIIVTPPISPEDFKMKMRGCVKEGSVIPRVDPLELKRIWEPR